MVHNQSLYHIKFIGILSPITLLEKQKYNLAGLGLQICLILKENREVCDSQQLFGGSNSTEAGVNRQTMAAFIINTN